MKRALTKFLSILMIIFGLYHIVLSMLAIFFIYPQVFSSKAISLKTQEGLIEKAIIIYLVVIIDGLYGASLFVKPSEEIKTIHILAGIIIFIFSIFFVTRTSLTADPLVLFFSELF